MLAPASDTNSKAKAATGLKTAVKILSRWGATMEQGEAILRVSHCTYAKAKKAESLEEVALDRDQLTRISYLLNIHAALRTLFDNPENHYSFMSMANHNPFFNGRTPLEIIATGGFADLYEVSQRIEGLHDLC